MPTPPYASAQMSINGGAPQLGGITISAGDTIQLSGANTVGWTSQRWDILDFPNTGFSAPGSWTTDSDGSFYSLSLTPPLITFPATGAWGKLAFRLRVNGGLTGSTDSSLTDVTAMVSVVSPNLGMPGLVATEETQYDTLRSWAGVVKSAFEKVEGKTGSKTWDPASVADGAMTSTTVTVTGAVYGNRAEVVSFTGTGIVAGLFFFAVVTATDTVTVSVFNKSGGAVDMGSGTLRVRTK